MARAYSPSEISLLKDSSLPFEGRWREAFGCPDRTGTWIVWGNSGNGKSSFVMQLAKELCRYGRVIYDSLEEGISLSFRNSLERFSMDEVNGRLQILDCERIDDLDERINKRRSADFIIIDSLQYAGISYAQYKTFKEAHSDKLIIFVSHADGVKPLGRTGVNIMYDSSVKIWVEGHRAFCKGRFIAHPGVYYTVWNEGAEHYWGNEDNNK